MNRYILASQSVHLWRVKADPSRTDRFIKVLSNDEQLRAGKFKFERDASTYITARYWLRWLLGNYLQMDPVQINFIYNDQGKPSLSHTGDIYFNVSHTKNHICMVFSRNLVGVDMEFNKKEIEIERIAQQFFSSRETEILLHLPANQRLPSFYYCWTRKEAFIKALGGGLSIPLDRFSVSLDPKAPEFLEINWDDEKVEDWVLSGFDFGEDYTGAIAIKHRNPNLSIIDI